MLIVRSIKSPILLIAGISLLLGSCQQNVYFNEFEESLLNVYNEGDTLIFESDNGKRDTTYILHKEIGYADWNPLAHAGKYKRLSGVVYNGSSKNISMGEFYPYSFLVIAKDSPDSTFIAIHYNGILASWTFRNFNERSWDRFKIEEGLYRFKIITNEIDRNTEEELYWHLKYGLVKYITEGGTTWKRINLALYP